MLREVANEARQADRASYACKMYVITLAIIGSLTMTSYTLLSNKSDDTVHITQIHTIAIVVNLDATFG
jgi:hypothetical protein